MTIAEYIAELKKFPQDMTILKTRHDGNGRYSYDTMDGLWLQMVVVVPSDSVLNSGRYYEPRGNDKRAIEALVI